MSLPRNNCGTLDILKELTLTTCGLHDRQKDKEAACDKVVVDYDIIGDPEYRYINCPDLRKSFQECEAASNEYKEQLKQCKLKK